jgi:hypothetical protein
MPQSPSEASVVKAYWQPGCTSCLRMKEFLTKHGVAFISVNDRRRRAPGPPPHAEA